MRQLEWLLCDAKTMENKFADISISQLEKVWVELPFENLSDYLHFYALQQEDIPQYMQRKKRAKPSSHVFKQLTLNTSASTTSNASSSVQTTPTALSSPTLKPSPPRPTLSAIAAMTRRSSNARKSSRHDRRFSVANSRKSSESKDLNTPQTVVHHWSGLHDAILLFHAIFNAHVKTKEEKNEFDLNFDSPINHQELERAFCLIEMFIKDPKYWNKRLLIECCALLYIGRYEPNSAKAKQVPVLLEWCLHKEKRTDSNQQQYPTPGGLVTLSSDIQILDPTTKKDLKERILHFRQQLSHAGSGMVSFGELELEVPTSVRLEAKSKWLRNHTENQLLPTLLLAERLSCRMLHLCKVGRLLHHEPLSTSSVSSIYVTEQGLHYTSEKLLINVRKSLQRLMRQLPPKNALHSTLRQVNARKWSKLLPQPKHQKLTTSTTISREEGVLDWKKSFVQEFLQQEIPEMERFLSYVWNIIEVLSTITEISSYNQDNNIISLVEHIVQGKTPPLWADEAGYKAASLSNMSKWSSWLHSTVRFYQTLVVQPTEALWLPAFKHPKCEYIL
jgi:hypothetical protein